MTINTTTELGTLTGNWVLDPHRTTIEFRTKMLGIFPVKGAFQAHQGRGQLAVDGTVDGSLVIDAASVNTGITKRDNHLRSADFFEVDKYPTITYVVSKATATNTGQVELLGQLEIHGRARPVTLLADVRTTAGSLTVSTVVDIDRSNWDFGKGPGVKNRVIVNAHFNRA